MPLANVVVVGASLAGLRAVEALRARGYDGKITWIGGETTLPYDRPPLSKQVLRGEWQVERATLKADYGALDVEVRLGVRATSLDTRGRSVHLEDGARVPYDGLVVATGARPRTLPWARGVEGVHTLRTLADALAIRERLKRGARVAIVGAGFIGLEVAASVRSLGPDVTVVEALRVPLMTALGEVMGARIVDLHRSHGVDFRTGVSVASLIGEARVEGLHLSDGSTVPADLVVVGVGVTPETEWLEGSGVDLEDGVVCDERCRASVSGIVACGDVARVRNALYGESMRIEHWTNAVEQASIAAANLLGTPDPPVFSSIPYFWSDQYDLKIQFAGRVRNGDELREVEGALETKDLVAVYERKGRAVGVVTVNKPGALVKYRRAIQEGIRTG